MFLSRVEIPWPAARNPYDLHRQLWRLFPGQNPEARIGGEDDRQGFLFRVEENLIGRSARVLVQSRLAPIGADGLVLLGSRDFDPHPTTGQRLAYVLTSNPVKTITDANREAKPGKRSEKCRVPLIKEQEQQQWLVRKLSGAAAIESCVVHSNVPLYFRKGNGGGKLVTVTFEGVLCVTEPGRLTTLLENGIGPAKGFGCGLLLVRRA